MDEALGGAEEGPHIVAEGASIIVAWKPHRMHCAELPSERGEGSLAAWVFSRFPETAPEAFAAREGGPAFDGGLLHRLDYETAGLVLFARNPGALRTLRLAQERDSIEKTYELLCSPGGGGLLGSRPLRGCPEGIDDSTWTASLDDAEALVAFLPGSVIRTMFRSYGPRGSRVACIAPALAGQRPPRGGPGRPYLTRLLSARLGKEGLVATVGLTRGFRHQIRAHFAWIGLPLLGDGLYGGKDWPSLGLVATEIAFDDPETGLPLRIRDNLIAPPLALA